MHGIHKIFRIFRKGWEEKGEGGEGENGRGRMASSGKACEELSLARSLVRLLACLLACSLARLFARAHKKPYLGKCRRRSRSRFSVRAGICYQHVAPSYVESPCGTPRIENNHNRKAATAAARRLIHTPTNQQRQHGTAAAAADPIVSVVELAMLGSRAATDTRRRAGRSLACVIGTTISPLPPCSSYRNSD